MAQRQRSLGEHLEYQEALAAAERRLADDGQRGIGAVAVKPVAATDANRPWHGTTLARVSVRVLMRDLESAESAIVVSDPGDDLRPILQHCRLVAGTDVHAELAVACRLDRAQTFHQLHPGAGESESANDLGRDDLFLLGTKEHEMAAVVREIPRSGGLISAIDVAVGIELGLELRRRGKSERAELLFLGVVVKDDRRRGPGLRPGAR